MPKIILTANTDWFLYNFRYALIHHLRDEGFDVTLVSPPGKFIQQFLEDGFSWIPWKLQRRSIVPWLELISLYHIVNIYRRERPDIVHHHTVKSVLYGSLAASLAGIPGIVNSISGRGYVFSGGDFQSRMIYRLIRPFYRYALRDVSSTVIFENQADRDFFIKSSFLSPERLCLIEGVGADPERFAPSPEPDNGSLVIVMAARTLWNKGVGVFVEAARILQKRLRVRMVLVGEPDPGNPTSVKVGALKEWHRQGIIEWWGWQQDMERVYEQCHIVALPTMYGEGVPTALLEAAACGRPVVATDMPGCRSVVQHEKNGLLIPPNDPLALAQALERLALDPSLRMRMGAAGRQIVLEKFTHKQINQATLQVYQHLLESFGME
ncbi:MAG: glycosyltransferase family 4 protein [Anaerolineales bacterium]|nr:glycosyltransferase family 4 protein [Anaerolineales bacterium]